MDLATSRLAACVVCCQCLARMLLQNYWRGERQERRLLLKWEVKAGERFV